MGRKPKVRSITVIGRRWFDRVNGNTYFSAVGLVNGEEKARINFQYGYGDHYLDCIGRELEKKGLITLKKYENGGREVLSWGYCKDRDIKFHAEVSDVSRKRDL